LGEKEVQDVSLRSVPNVTELRLLFDVFPCELGDGAFFWASGFANSWRRAFSGTPGIFERLAFLAVKREEGSAT
jgi:hypothetical protein